MKDHPSLMKPSATPPPAPPARPITINADRIPRAYDAYRTTVLDLLEKTRDRFLDVAQANSIEEIRDILNQNDASFMRLAANVEKLLPFFDKLVANADLEHAVLTKLNRIVDQELAKP